MNLLNTVIIVIASNDYIQDFIDSMLILTNDHNDRIGKRTMHKNSMKFILLDI